jgi:hypothetical protein
MRQSRLARIGDGFSGPKIRKMWRAAMAENLLPRICSDMGHPPHVIRGFQKLAIVVEFD